MTHAQAREMASGFRGVFRDVNIFATEEARQRNQRYHVRANGEFRTGANFQNVAQSWAELWADWNPHLDITVVDSRTGEELIKYERKA